MFDGQMHGIGKLTYENDEYYHGDFVRGTAANVTDVLYHSHYQPQQYLIIWNTCNIYQGKRHGLGQYTYSDGSVFKGMRVFYHLIHMFFLYMNGGTSTFPSLSLLCYFTIEIDNIFPRNFCINWIIDNDRIDCVILFHKCKYVAHYDQYFANNSYLISNCYLTVHATFALLDWLRRKVYVFYKYDFMS